MKVEVSKREKILLFVVGLILIIYLAVQFVIVPLGTRYNEGLEERDRLNIEKSTHIREVEALPELRTRNREAHERFASLIAEYPPLVPNEVTDRTLTELFDKNNLGITRVQFSPRPVLPPPVITQPDTVRYNDDGTVNEEPVPEPPVSVFTKVTVALTVTGSYQNFLRLINEVEGIEHMRLPSVRYAQDWQNIDLNASNIQLTFEITYLTEEN
jgi:hypothetical protein